VLRREGGVEKALLVWAVALWTDQDRASLQESLPSLQQQARLVEQRLRAQVVPVVLTYIAGSVRGPIASSNGVVLETASTAKDLLCGVPQMLVKRLRGTSHAL